MSSSDLLLLIPARGGSQRIPGKHLRALAGHSLLAWTLAPALAAGLGRPVVTSEDDAILGFAAGWGAATIRRPANLARDDTPDLPVLKHALREVWGAAPRRWLGRVLWLRPTSPFRRPEEIRQVADLLEGVLGSVRSVRVAHEHPWKSYVLLPSGFLVPAGTATRQNHPSQALPGAFVPTGFIDGLWVGGPLRTMDARPIRPWYGHDERAHLELDEEDDWIRAERMAAKGGWTPGGII